MVNERKAPEMRFDGFIEPWETMKWAETVDMSTNMVDPRKPEYQNLLHIGPGNIESYTGLLYDNIKTAKDEGLISGKFHFHVDDIIYGKINPQLAKYTTAKFEGLASADAYVLNAKNGLVQGFLYMILQRQPFYDYTVSVSRRSGMPKINRDELNDFSFIAPSTTAEQNAIGNFFRNLDETIVLKKQQYEQTVNIKKAMLEKMFPKKGADVPEIRFEGFSGAWGVKLLGDATELYDNLRIPVAENLRKPGKTPYYGANGVQGYIDGYTHDGEYVLVAEDGASDLLNYPVIYVSGRIWANNHVHVLQGKAKETNTLYLSYALKTADFQAVLVGGTRAKLNAGAIKEMSIFITSLEEQIIIGNFFNNLDTLITAQREELKKLQNIKKACLSKMFV